MGKGGKVTKIILVFNLFLWNCHIRPPGLGLWLFQITSNVAVVAKLPRTTGVSLVHVHRASQVGWFSLEKKKKRKLLFTWFRVEFLIKPWMNKELIFKRNSFLFCFVCRTALYLWYSILYPCLCLANDYDIWCRLWIESFLLLLDWHIH